MNKKDFATLLEPYQLLTEKKIRENIKNFGEKSPLRDACEYSLTTGGKRFRPALVFMIAKELGFNYEVTPAALGVEFFHTASLVADDLPCMDNDDLRRNRPAVHKVYGESTALLVTYALIAAGYEAISRNTIHLRGQNPQADAICQLALENAAHNTGFFGATGGQYFDINPKDLTQKSIRQMIHWKTVSLFEIAFVFGWLFGGGNPAKLDAVKKCASHFGLAFQIADDFDDILQDKKSDRKGNMVLALGKSEARTMFLEELDSYQKLLLDLNLGGDLKSIGEFLQNGLL
jgi:geranylgeranyl diphosphate synthase type II